MTAGTPFRAPSAVPLDVTGRVVLDVVVPVWRVLGRRSRAEPRRVQAAVAAGEVRYYVEGGGPGGRPGARGTSGEIRAWVQSHFTPIDVAGGTVYDLGAPRP
jgi:hypothetical protein